MEKLLVNFNHIKDRIKCGSKEVPNSEYPLIVFWVGLFFTKNDNFEETFNLFELLESSRCRGTINQESYLKIIKYLFQNPKWFYTLKELLMKVIKNQIDIVKQLEMLEINGQGVNIPVRAESKDTVIMVENDKSNSHTEEYLGQDEEIARRLQEEEDNMVKNVKLDETSCEICYVGLYQQNFSLLDGCGHLFHTECLKESFKINITQNRFPLLCPNDSCKKQLTDSEIKQILSEELYKKYQEHTLKSYADMHGDSISWCPTANCQYLFFHEKGDDVRFGCEECKKQYCLACRVQWHKQMSCKEFQVSNTTSEDDKKFLDFVKGKKFKQCPKCKFWVQKNEGCDHMTCKCKFEFCYKCGGVYMKCQCVEKQKQLMRIRQQQAEARRRKKTERDAKNRQKERQRQLQKQKEPSRPTRSRNKR